MPILKSLSFPLEDSNLAKEKIMGMFHHVAGTHNFPEHEVFKKCEHGILDESRRPYIPAGWTDRLTDHPTN